MKGILILAGALALTGCVTAPVSIDRAEQVPAERLFAFQQTPGPNDGTLVLIRDSGALGSGCRIVIYIDDVRAASFSTKEKAELTIPSGEHILASGPTGNGICGMGKGKESLKRSIAIHIKPGHASIYRIAIGNGGVDVMPTTL